MEPKLYIVVPCYNETEVLPETNKRLLEKLNRMVGASLIAPTSRILYVDDGSKDGTWSMISSMCEASDRVCGLKLSRNRGHQNALLAGLFTAASEEEDGGNADIVISMDADLQDDIEVMDRFVEKYKKGSDIVYGVRSSRKKDSLFKRSTAQTFYRMMRGMGVELVYNHADYRLMSKRAIHALSEFREVNLFLRGIVPMIGFQTAEVPYERGKRFAGESKYPLRKMIRFAIEGITSCSVRPLRMITMAGLIISLLSIIMLIHVIRGFLMGETVEGWATVVVSLFFLGGFQIFAIGIVGEYIGKIYLETKARPRFVVEEKQLK